MPWLMAQPCATPGPCPLDAPWLAHGPWPCSMDPVLLPLSLMLPPPPLDPTASSRPHLSMHCSWLCHPCPWLVDSPLRHHATCAIPTIHALCRCILPTSHMSRPRLTRLAHVSHVSPTSHMSCPHLTHLAHVSHVGAVDEGHTIHLTCIT